MYPGCHVHADDARPEMACRGRQVRHTRGGDGEVGSAVAETMLQRMRQGDVPGIQRRSSTTSGAFQPTTEFSSNAE
jgi:hypothetical protein